MAHSPLCVSFLPSVVCCFRRVVLVMLEGDTQNTNMEPTPPPMYKCPHFDKSTIDFEIYLVGLFSTPAPNLTHVFASI